MATGSRVGNCPSFWRAVAEGKIEETRRLLQTDRSLVDARDNRSLKWQQTALHKASSRGHFAVCCLLLVFGADKDSVDRYQQTALHIASREGHLDICSLLLECRADKESVDMWQQTALHLASIGGHLDICRLLLECGAGKDSVDVNKWTPFFTAAFHGHVPVMQLLKSAKCNVETRSKHGNGAMVIASMKGKVGAVEFLIKNGFNVNEKHSKGRTALHFAGRGPAWDQQYNQSGRVHVVEILLENKADAGVVDEDGKRPYDLATGDLKRMLRKAYEDQINAAVYSEGTVEPSVLKLCFTGSEGAGKTTLVEAVKQSELLDENQLDDPHCIEQRTVGIAVSTVDVPGVGRVSVYDVAGQSQFHKTHGFFFSAANAFFILLLSLVTGGEIRNRPELYKEAKYWLCFLRASIDKRIIPTVIIAASRLDRFPRGGEILQQLTDLMRRMFDGKLNISSKAFAMDCRKKSSKEIIQFRQHIRELKMQRKALYPRLCEPVVTEVLPALRQQQQDLFIYTSQLVEAIRQRSPMQDRGTIDKVISFLDACAELLLFGHLSILDIPFLCMDVLGPLMAPDNFPCHLMGKLDGKVKKADISYVIRQFQSLHKKSFSVQIDNIIHLLESFELTFLVEGTDDTYMFPSHLPFKKVADMWKRDDRNKVYVGRRVKCSSETSIISPGAFSLFQCRACVRLHRQAQLWENGIIIRRAKTVRSHVQCLVIMAIPLGAVDIVCRGGVGCEKECKSLLEEVMTLWLDVIEEHSSGTEYEIRYLSRQHMSEHREEIADYTQEEVDEVKEEGPEAAVLKVTEDYEIVESLSDLMVFDTPVETQQHHFVYSSNAMFQAIVKYGVSQYFALGREVGFSNAEIESLCYNKAAFSDKLLAIIGRRIDEDGVEAAEEAFLDACKKIPLPIYHAVMRELDSQH